MGLCGLTAWVDSPSCQGSQSSSNFGAGCHTASTVRKQSTMTASSHLIFSYSYSPRRAATPNEQLFTPQFNQEISQQHGQRPFTDVTVGIDSRNFFLAQEDLGLAGGSCLRTELFYLAAFFLSSTPNLSLRKRQGAPPPVHFLALCMCSFSIQSFLVSIC